MAVIIAGMQAAIDSCKSLEQYERSLYSDIPCTKSADRNPSQVALSALQDADLEDLNNLILISSPDSELMDLPSVLGLQSKQYQSIAPIDGSDYVVLEQADRLIQEDPQRIVLLTLTTGNNTVSLVLLHPDQNVPAYAVLDNLESDPINKEKLNSVSYLDYSRGINTLDQNQFQSLCNLFAGDYQEPSIALGSKSFGSSPRSGLENFLYVALLINRKLIPGANEFLDETIDPPEENPFYIPEGTRPWLNQGPGYLRTALLVLPGDQTKNWDHWLAWEPDRSKPLPSVRPSLKGTEPYLLPITGHSLSDLQDNLDLIESKLKTETPLKDIVFDSYTKYSEDKSGFICSLVGSNKPDLIKEILHAKKGIEEVGNTKGTWSSPKGSYFTADPLGTSGIGFVYPGAFNSYPYMGQNLFDYFPSIHQSIKKIIKNISHSYSERFLFPKDLFPNPDKKNLDLMSELYNHPSELIESGISMSVLLTMILKDTFKITPEAALGYSLGEMSMLWANDVWLGAEETSNSWKESTLFNDRLFGKMTILREYWKDQQFQENFWGSYILKAPLESVQDVIQGESQVFLTIINTQNEIVIAGVREVCQQVIAKLECHALPMPFNTAIHNQAMSAVYPDFVELYSNEVNNKNDMRFYSAAECQALELDSESLAQAMAKMICNQINFPALITKAYQDGIRIFIEVGPQKTCSRWIERILDSKQHAVIPVNKKHQSDFIGVLKVLSMLTSHQVPMDLSPLYSEMRKDDQNNSNIINKDSNQDNAAAMDDPFSKSNDPLSIEPGHIEYQETSQELDSEYLEHLTKLSTDLTISHQKFLGTQGTLTRNISRILALQAGFPPDTVFLENDPDPLYSEDQIIAFTIGDPKECFGDLFAGFEGQRIPRLPNGPLRYIDRVYKIDGPKGTVHNTSSLVSDVDIQSHNWYLPAGEGTLPYVSLMEIALQPCGFLSAYMGSIKDKSGVDLYFRNLDGETTLADWPNIINNAITNRVELISSTTLQDVIIQEYSFELFSEGKSFLQGTSSFGYFTKQMLSNQSGLDGAKTVSQWMESNRDSGEWVKRSESDSMTSDPETPHLPEIPQVWVSKSGGIHSEGYLYANLEVPTNSWFYDAHFYQDPVMPGSLGVEAMARTIMQSSPTWGIPQSNRWRIIPGNTTKWKYRGEITKETDQITIEIHLQNIQTEGSRSQIIADGYLWKGKTRIYQINNIGLETY